MGYDGNTILKQWYSSSSEIEIASDIEYGMEWHHSSPPADSQSLQLLCKCNY
jgi:hypothetical protein